MPEIIKDVKSLTYKADTEAGMCGSPIFNGLNKVLGMHYGVFRGDPERMIGRPITIDLIKKLFEWKDQLDGQPFRVHYPDSLEEPVAVDSIKLLDKVHYQSSIRSILTVDY